MDDKSIRDVVRARIIKAIEPVPESEEGIQKPSKGALAHALFDFNIFFLILDAISAGVVGWLTFWFYAPLAFVAGIYPMIGWEHKFKSGYNSTGQKWISGIGICIGAFSTILIAVLCAVTSIMKLNSIGGLDTFDLILAISLVSIVCVHGIMNGLYYFIDGGILAVQKFVEKLATQENALRDIRLAGQLGKAAKKTEDEAVTQLGQDHGAYVNSAYKSLTGEAFTPTRSIRSMAADTTRPELQESRPTQANSKQ